MHYFIIRPGYSVNVSIWVQNCVVGMSLTCHIVMMHEFELQSYTFFPGGAAQHTASPIRTDSTVSLR